MLFRSVDQLWRQVVGAVAVLVFSFVLTLLIGFVLEKTVGFRVAEDVELEGVDSVEHAESAYDLGNLAGTLRSTGALGSTLAHRTAPAEKIDTEAEKEVNA